MADSKPRFEPKLITWKRGRLAFFRPEPVARLGKDGKPKGDPKASATILLDPTNKEHAETILLIKQESVRALNFRYEGDKFNVKLLEEVAAGTKSFPNFHLCWGLGNDLPAHGKKLYDGFKDMFFIKLSDKNRPNLLNRDGRPVKPGEAQYPFAGCYTAGTSTLYSYDNESRGVNANLRTVVYMDTGPAFGGGQADADSEFAALGDLGAAPAAGLSDPFGAAGSASADPFALK